jgi:hypothetical protein
MALRKNQKVSTKWWSGLKGPLRSRSNRSIQKVLLSQTLDDQWLLVPHVQPSGPPWISQSGTLEHRYKKTPSVQWARPFCNTQTFLFYLKTLQLFSLLISITASSQWKSSKSDKSTSLSTFGVGFSWQGGSKNPFFQNVGNQNPFSKTLQFCWYLNNISFLWHKSLYCSVSIILMSVILLSDILLSGILLSVILLRVSHAVYLCAV